VEIGTEAAQFPEKEYKNGIFFVVYLVWGKAIPKRFATFTFFDVFVLFLVTQYVL
jgi:hypothetical protein